MLTVQSVSMYVCCSLSFSLSVTSMFDNYTFSVECLLWLFCYQDKSFFVKVFNLYLLIDLLETSMKYFGLTNILKAFDNIGRYWLKYVFKFWRSECPLPPLSSKTTSFPPDPSFPPDHPK